MTISRPGDCTTRGLKLLAFALGVRRRHFRRIFSATQGLISLRFSCGSSQLAGEVVSAEWPTSTAVLAPSLSFVPQSCVPPRPGQSLVRPKRTSPNLRSALSAPPWYEMLTAAGILPRRSQARAGGERARSRAPHARASASLRGGSRCRRRFHDHSRRIYAHVPTLGQDELFNVLTGSTRPTGGEFTFDGHPLNDFKRTKSPSAGSHALP